MMHFQITYGPNRPTRTKEFAEKILAGVTNEWQSTIAICKKIGMGQSSTYQYLMLLNGTALYGTKVVEMQFKASPKTGRPIAYWRKGEPNVSMETTD